MIKAIETRYKGYRFRSRLEARWAVFFDSLGFEWEYEPEGYELSDGTWYLPDFKIKDKDDGFFWFEVKGGKATKKDIKKLQMLCDGTEAFGYISSGTMGVPTMSKKDGFAHAYEGAKIYCRRPKSLIESNCEGPTKEEVSLFNKIEDDAICAFYEDGDGCISIDHVYTHDTIDENNISKLKMPLFIKNKKGDLVDIAEQFRDKGGNLWLVMKVLENGRLIQSLNSGSGRFYRSKKLKSAYEKARSARFEHGEKG